jgi:AcrR family transcriptional regulator
MHKMKKTNVIPIHRGRPKRSPLTRRERKAQTRRTLIEAALGLIEDGGFAGLSLREVTRQAGVAPATFYRHFSDMEDLGLALIDEVGLMLRQLMRKGRKRISETGSVTRSSVEIFMEFVQNNGNLFRLLLGERIGNTPSFRTALQAELNRFIAELTEDLECQAHHLKVSLGDPSIAAEAIVAVVFSAGLEALDIPVHHRKQLTERLIKEIRMILVGAAVMAKGR